MLKFLDKISVKDSVKCISKTYNTYKLKKEAREFQKRKMAENDPHILEPPENIRGLKIMNRNLFNKDIKVPTVHVGSLVVSKIMPFLKKYLLKMENLKPVRETDNNERYVILNPILVNKWTDLAPEDREKLFNLSVSEKNFSHIDFTLSYDNWKADDLLKHILPSDQTSVAGFSKIGHIVHLNLKDHVLDYKQIIGEILHDKIKGCRTVVNKLDKIDSTYRNFEMEILYGEPDFFVQVKENHCTFEFDFSKVYWNPRLATEHERILNLLKPGDILYDVFAGVGPFAIPAAKKKCLVLANDLNPDSFKYLQHNMKLNKIKDGDLLCYNKDGRDFIENELKNDLRTHITGINSEKPPNIHITMNLPGIATEFLNAFNGLYKFHPDVNKIENVTIHVYCFAKGENPVEIARNLVEQGLQHKITNLIEIFNVRKVSSYKEMMRVSFKLTKEILFDTKKRKTEASGTNDDHKKCKNCF